MPEFISRGDAFALVESLGYEAVAELGNTTVFASTQAPLEEARFTLNIEDPVRLAALEEFLIDQVGVPDARVYADVEQLWPRG